MVERMKKCERCGSEAVSNLRYCKDCKKQVLKELRDCGYLEPKPFGHAGDKRPPEARENRYETKNGRD
jgi:predicted amidophosphoribosyltransferase